MHWVNAYIGQAWRPDYHCWSLLQAVYQARLNLCLPPMQYDANSLLAAIRAFGTQQGEYAHWQQVDTPQELDAVVMAVANRPRHIGVWVALDEGYILHNLEQRGVVLSRVDELNHLNFQVYAYYRRR